MVSSGAISGTTGTFSGAVQTVGLTNTIASGNVIALLDSSNASQNHRVRINSQGASSSTSLAISNSNANNQTSLLHGNDGVFTIRNGQTAGSEPTSGSERLRIDSSGRLLLAYTSSQTIGGNSHPLVQLNVNSNQQVLSLARFENVVAGPSLILGKSRASSAGNYTVVQSGDGLGNIAFAGADGTDLVSVGANFEAHVDGTPGSNDMPGRLVFSTTADGASSPTERARITSTGKVGISTVSPDARLHILAGNEKGILIEDNSTSNNAPYLEIIGKRDDGNVHQSFSGQIFLSRNRTAQKISAGLKLGTIMFGGNHTNASKSNIAYPASIAGMSSGDFNSVTDMPTDLVFFTGSTGRTPSTSNVSSGEEAMRIASSGAVTKPLQPRFWAKSNSGQTLNTDSSNYIRDFTSEQFDTGGCYDGTNKFTAPVNGYYHFGWHVMVNASHADSFTYFFGAPLVSGVDIQQEVMMPRSGGANYASLTASHLLYLTAGQYVQIRLRQSGGTGNMEVRSDQGYFWGYLVN